MPEELALWAESIVSGRTFDPLVNVRLGRCIYRPIYTR